MSRVADLLAWTWPASLGGILGPATAAVLAALPFVAAGVLVERRHYRRLEEGAARLGHVRLHAAPGPLPEGVPTRFVEACVCLAPSPLGRLSVLVRRIIGGRVDLLHRTKDRAIREALLRLRERAAAEGASAVVGVRVAGVPLGRRDSVSIVAHGTAVVGGLGPEGLAPLVEDARFLDAAGSPPPRGGAQLVLLAAGTLAALALATAVEGLVGPSFPGLDEHLERWFRLP